MPDGPFRPALKVHQAADVGRGDDRRLFMDLFQHVMAVLAFLGIRGRQLAGTDLALRQVTVCIEDVDAVDDRAERNVIVVPLRVVL